MAAASADSAAAMTRRSALSRSIFPSLRASSSHALAIASARSSFSAHERASSSPSAAAASASCRAAAATRGRLARCARANRLFRLRDALRECVALLLQNRARARLRAKLGAQRRQCAAEGRWRVPKRVVLQSAVDTFSLLCCLDDFVITLVASRRTPKGRTVRV